MADTTDRRYRRGGTNPIDDLRESITDPKDFKPFHKVVPPVHSVTWPKRYFWCSNYCLKGWKGLKGTEQDEICHAINVPLDYVTTRVLDEQVIFALVGLSYTREAVVEFFMRPDTSMEMPGQAVSALYDRALEQIRAMLYTRADAGIGVRKVPLMRHLVRVLADEGAEGAPAVDEILRTIWCLNFMRKADNPWPGLVEVQALNPIYYEIPHRDRLYIRPSFAANVVNRWISESGHRITPISLPKISSTQSMYYHVTPPWVTSLRSTFTHVLMPAGAGREKEVITMSAMALTRSYLITQLKVWDGLLHQPIGRSYTEYLRKHRSTGGRKRGSKIVALPDGSRRLMPPDEEKTP